MKEIPLTHGKIALVDDEDFDRVMKHKWFALRDHHYDRFYAAREELRTIYMHRVILSLERSDRRQVDHINHDGLDNRRGNLRIVTPAENQFNQIIRLGYYQSKRSRKFTAEIRIHGRKTYLGSFDTATEAHAAYLEAKRLYHRIERSA